jgi:hypothetical protein
LPVLENALYSGKTAIRYFLLRKQSIKRKGEKKDTQKPVMKRNERSLHKTKVAE